MTEQLYPKQHKVSPQTKRKWRVDYALVYDNGLFEFSKWYRTKWFAKFSAFMHYYIYSYGGSATLAREDDKESFVQDGAAASETVPDEEEAVS